MTWRWGKRPRKGWVVLHVLSSVGWLGLTMGNFVLVFIAANTSDPPLQHGAHLAMDAAGAILLLPISLLAFVSGVALSLGTPWGLFRWWWVAIKFGLTLLAVVLTAFSLLPGLRQAAAVVRATAPGALAEIEYRGQIAAVCVSSAMYLAMVVLSVVKPGGKIRKKIVVTGVEPVRAG